MAAVDGTAELPAQKATEAEQDAPVAAYLTEHGVPAPATTGPAVA